jgi:ankyrin repeat protein
MKRAFFTIAVIAVGLFTGYTCWIGYLFINGGWCANADMLVWLIARGEVEQAEKLLRWNPRLVDPMDPPERRPLHVACEMQQLGSAKLLIRYGADLNRRDQHVRTPLHNAVQTGNVAIVRLLLENGAEVDLEDDSKLTPLHNAVREGTPELVSLLLDKGARLDYRHAHSGRSPLHFASCGGNLKVVEMLAARGANACAVSIDGHSAVYDAIRGEHYETAEFLLAKGAPLDFVSAAGLGEEKFVSAALDGLKAVDAPLQRMPHIVRPSADGKGAAMHVAACGGRTAVVRLLLDAGVAVHGSEGWGNPLHDAVQRNREGVVRLLLARGADINAKNQHGKSPLYVAAYHRQHAMARLLLKMGADINQANSDGETVVYYLAAPVEEDLPMLEMVLKAGANPNVRCNGMTPLQRAVNRTAIEKILRQFGAK